MLIALGAAIFWLSMDAITHISQAYDEVCDVQSAVGRCRLIGRDLMLLRFVPSAQQLVSPSRLPASGVLDPRRDCYSMAY